MWQQFCILTLGLSYEGSHGDTIQHQGGSGMYFAQTIGLALSNDGEGMAEEQGETRGKSLGRTVMLTFASLCGFTPSLSKDAQEAAACCTSALPPHGVLLPKGLWSGAAWGAQHLAALAPSSASSPPQWLQYFSQCRRDTGCILQQLHLGLGRCASVGEKGCVYGRVFF